MGTVSQNLTKAEGTICVNKFASESQVKSLLVVLNKNGSLLYTVGGVTASQYSESCYNIFNSGVDSYFNLHIFLSFLLSLLTLGG